MKTQTNGRMNVAKERQQQEKKKHTHTLTHTSDTHHTHKTDSNSLTIKKTTAVSIPSDNERNRETTVRAGLNSTGINVFIF